MGLITDIYKPEERKFGESTYSKAGAEYQPVLPYEQAATWSGKPGYITKRYIGGPAQRAIEAFQQTFIYAPIAKARGTLPEEWELDDPWSRIIYPGANSRIREYAVTGTENPWINLPFAILADPINIIGGVGAVTKLGKASRLVRGLGGAAEIKGILTHADDIYDYLKGIGKIEGATGIQKAIRNIIFKDIDTARGVKTWQLKRLEREFKTYEPLWKEYGKYGDTVFDAPRRLSEAIATGKAAVFGVGAKAGIGGASDWDLGAWNHLRAVKQMEWIEDVYQGARHKLLPKLYPYTTKTRMLGLLTEDIVKRKELLEKVPTRDVELPGKIGRLQKEFEKTVKWTDRRYAKLSKESKVKFDKVMRLADKLEKSGLRISKKIDEKYERAVKLLDKIDVKKGDYADLREGFDDYLKFNDELDGIGREIEDALDSLTDAELTRAVQMEHKNPQSFVRKNPKFQELASKFQRYNRVKNHVQQTVDRLNKKLEGAWENIINDTNKVREYEDQIGKLEDEVRKLTEKGQKIRDTALERRLTKLQKERAKIIEQLTKKQDNIDGLVNQWNEFVEGKGQYLEGIRELLGKKAGAAIREIGMEHVIKNLKDNVTWNAHRLLRQVGKQAKKDILDVIYKNAKTPAEKKTIDRLFAKAIKGDPAIDLFQYPELQQAVAHYNELMYDMIAKGEAKYRGFNLLDNYIMWNLKRSKGGQTISSSFFDWMMGRAADNIRKMGYMDKMHLRRSAGKDPWISVTNPSHYKRNTEVVNELKSIETLMTRSRDEALIAGKGELADEITEAMRPIQKLNEIWKSKIRPDMSPHEVNEILRAEMGDEILEFMGSKQGKKWGFKDTDDLDAFEFYEESFNKIIPERIKRYGETISSGETLENFLMRFGFYEDRILRQAGQMDELAVLQEFATERGQNIVKVKDYLKDRFGRTDASINNILGKMLGDKLENLHMDSSAADAFGDLLKAWEKLPQTQGIAKYYDHVLRWWARMTLFGGRASYLFNNFVGDRWNMMLAGAEPKYWSGIKGLELMLPENRMLKGLPGIKGASDDTVMFISKNGIAYTKKEIMDLSAIYQIDGGIYDSMIFQVVDEAHKLDERSLLQALREDKSITEIPRRIAQFSEKNGRYSLFMHFLEQGYHPSEAAQGVAKYLFDYTKQNQTMRRIAPFYFWTSKNVPLQFTNMFKQPGKMAIPTKVQWAFESSDDPTELATPSYLQSSGIYVGRYNDKDIYIDLNNVPSYAAQEITGILDSGEGLEEMLQGIAQRGLMMGSPVLSMIPEFAFNKDVLSGKPIVGGGGGFVPERGIKNFMGFNIQGIRWAQIGAHVTESVFTPSQLINTYIQSARDKRKEMPVPYKALKYIGGVPVRQSDPDVAMWLNLMRKKNAYVINAEKYEALGNRHMQIKYETLARQLNNEIRQVTERLNRKKREEELKEKRQGR